MFKKIKQLSITIATTLLFAIPVMVPVSANAAPTGTPGAATTGASIQDSLCNGINNANGSDTPLGTTGTASNCTTEQGPTTLNSVIHTVVNVFSMIVGAVSIIMIIYGGFKYITSGGNDGNVGSAKSTILYAVIGLIVVALAQVIVRFVLSKATA